MIILGVDIGNTHGEIGIFKEDKLISTIRLSSTLQRTEDEYWFYIERFLQKQNISNKEIEDVVISSVVPDLNFVFQKLSQKYFGKEGFFITSEKKLGIKINIPLPQEVGADRLCCAVAGYEQFKSDLIIIDFGTATTFDIIFKEGAYEGGIIASGLETTNWGLHKKAAKLPQVKLEFPDRVVGKNTDNAIQSGLMYGEVAMIDGIIERILDEEKREFKIIVTGGLGTKIIPYLQHKVISKPTLLMEGLYGIYKKNK